MNERPEDNICPVCGGLKRIGYTVIFEECMPHEIRVEDSRPLRRLCPGHPRPIDEQTISRGVPNEMKCHWEHGMVEIGSYYDQYLFERVFLTPEKALSLLDWLKQEQDKLEQLVKEQQS